MSTMLNPVWLRTFVSLVETKHFTKTASVLHMTQPGVTQHLQRLEAACGGSLIVRSGKSFEINEHGAIVYQYACQLFDNEQELHQKLSVDDPYSGEISFACSGSIAQVLYPHFINLMRAYPNLSIINEAAPNQVILQSIQDKKIQLGVVTQLSENLAYEVSALGCQQLVLVIPRSYATHKIDLKLLQQLGSIEHPDFYNYLDLYCAASALPWVNELQHASLTKQSYVNQIQQILLPLSMGLGFTVIPRHTVDVFEQKDKLHIVEDSNVVQQELFLVHKRLHALPSRYQQIIDLCKQQLF
ncbi:LysR family transcriptional regulator [Alginatibacterium sediminis]|uniref:LysR family transcriptional regulator n=1 Tax=Alginatibacterium sediminis TaxID=2164068 RepID=A0A420EH53_9ALTE|nr:LysR family transcriptional regulator [Alginatibacterium sediminis]RKF20013.1 LysR family transcriptional regulator [Alginatibacterium sediminis]